MRTKFLLISLIIVSLIFSSCAIEDTDLLNITPKTTINISLSRELSSLNETVIDGLIKPLNQISNERFTINFSITDNPLEAIQGGSHIVIMSNSEVSLANSQFAMLTSPFYFEGYQHASITLGLEEFHDLVDDTTLSLVGAVPIASLYAGGYYLVSGIDEPIADFEALEDLRVGVLPNNTYFEVLLEEMGADANIQETDVLVNGFLNRSFPVIEAKGSDLDLILPSDRISTVFYSESPHRIDMNWVMMSQNAIETLTPEELAYLKEGVASLVAYNDIEMLSNEETALEQLKFQIDAISDSISYNDLSNETRTILFTLYQFNNIWDWGLYSEVKELLE